LERPFAGWSQRCSWVGVAPTGPLGRPSVRAASRGGPTLTYRTSPRSSYSWLSKVIPAIVTGRSARVRGPDPPRERRLLIASRIPGMCRSICGLRRAKWASVRSSSTTRRPSGSVVSRIYAVTQGSVGAATDGHSRASYATRANQPCADRASRRTATRSRRKGVRAALASTTASGQIPKRGSASGITPRTPDPRLAPVPDAFRPTRRLGADPGRILGN
jgi:hypothetical protein